MSTSPVRLVFTLLGIAACLVSSAQEIGRMLVQTRDGTVRGKAYTSVHALLIGVNRYPALPRGVQLAHAVNDAKVLGKVLAEHYGFADVTVLTDAQATLSNIRSALSAFADSDRVKPDDLVVVYFSGHGQTVPLANGGAMGFLVPSDAKVDLDNPKNSSSYLATCLPMKQIWDYLELSPAKHAVVLADACFSGLMARSRGGGGLSAAALEVMLARRARQVITAGSGGEKTVERDDLGHGVFTAKLIDELKARSAVKDRAFTVSDLFASLQEQVANATGGKQTPQMGNFDSEGEALFIPSAAPPKVDPPKVDPPKVDPPKVDPPKVDAEAKLPAAAVPAGLTKRQGEYYLLLRDLLAQAQGRFAGVPRKARTTSRLIGPNEVKLVEMERPLPGFKFGGVTDRGSLDSLLYFEGAPVQGRQVFADYKAAIKALLPKGREQNFEATHWRISDGDFQITLFRELEDTWRVEQVFQKMWLSIVRTK